MVNHWLRELRLTCVLRVAFFFIVLIGATFQIACSQKGSDADNSQTSSSQTTSSTTAVVPLRITGVSPDAAVDGAEVTVAFTGGDSSAAGTPQAAAITPSYQAVLAGKALEASLVAGNANALKFTVPAGAASGPLYIREGDRKSNAVWFSVSDISVVTPGPEDVVLDELGNEVAVNLVVVSIKDGYEASVEAQRIADTFGAKIVGKIPLISGYQLRLTTTTLDTLRIQIAAIKTDAAVDFVLMDQTLPGNSHIWDPGIGLPGEQRAANRVEEGASLYTQSVHPSEPGKARPLFTSIGIVENNGVDFDTLDFSGYGIGNGTNRYQGITVFATDAKAPSSHGTTVTGVVAAQMNDTCNSNLLCQPLPDNAGFLQALHGSHGGFTINVHKGSSLADVLSGESRIRWTSGVMATTNEMLEDGARIINWSFGAYKEGATRSNGQSADTLEDKQELSNGTSHKKSAEFIDDAKAAFSKALREIENKYPRALIVNAAGNNDINVENWVVPGGVKSDSLLVVGAHTDGGQPAGSGKACNNDKWPNNSTQTIARENFSNYGDRVDITAADTVFRSDGTVTCGTSFSAPLVTAAVAAMLSIDPDLTAKQIKMFLRKSALPIGAGVTNQYGVVTDHVTAPLTADEVGASGNVDKGARLDVYSAIQAALDSANGKTVPKGDEINVTLESGDVTRTVSYTAPDGVVFDKVDILFLVDVSGSYGDDLAQFKSQALALVDTFKAGGANVQIGVASFSDFPISPYGGSGDYAYRLHQDLTTDATLVTNAINGLTLKNGSDGPESQLEALYQAATGAGRIVAGVPAADITATSVGWRTGALPIIFLATDASFHNSDAETAYPGAGWTQTLASLNAKKVRVYGLQAGGTITDVVNMANATGGTAFALLSNSSDIKTAIDNALNTANSSVNIRLVKNGDFAGLIKSITPLDGYKGVTPGETKQFEVTFSRDWFEESGDYVFALRLEVLADDVAVVQEIPVIVQIK